MSSCEQDKICNTHLLIRNKQVHQQLSNDYCYGSDRVLNTKFKVDEMKVKHNMYQMWYITKAEKWLFFNLAKISKFPQ